MNLTITHADGTTGSYAVNDSTVLAFDGQAVALGGVTAVALSDAPAAPVEEPPAPAAPGEEPTPQPQPEPALPVVVAPAAPAAQPASAGMLARAAAFYRWTKSPMGRKDIALILAAAEAIYTGIHRAGL